MGNEMETMLVSHILWIRVTVIVVEQYMVNEIETKSISHILYIRLIVIVT